MLATSMSYTMLACKQITVDRASNRKQRKTLNAATKLQEQKKKRETSETGDRIRKMDYAEEASKHFHM